MSDKQGLSGLPDDILSDFLTPNQCCELLWLLQDWKRYKTDEGREIERKLKVLIDYSKKVQKHYKRRNK